MRRLIQWLVALAAFGVPTSAVGDDLEDFAIAPADFVPSSSQGATAVWGHRLFVAGFGTTLDPTSRDAVIVAVDTRRATEVWRAIAGEPGRADSFDSVAASDGRVCAVGRGVESFVTSVMLVACYEAKTGKLLWEREFPIGLTPVNPFDPGSRFLIDRRSGSLIVRKLGFPFVSTAFSIQLSGKALVVTTNDPFTGRPRVLLFDARDGS